MQVKSIDLADTFYQEFSWVRPGFVVCCTLMVEFYGAPELLRAYRCNEPPRSGSMRAYLVVVLATDLVWPALGVQALDSH